MQSVVHRDWGSDSHCPHRVS